jgi:nicotinate phosphoribosyltransferase
MVQLRSILDTDLYKITMQYAVLSAYPDALARYQFINRGKTIFPNEFKKTLEESVFKMADLCLTNSEVTFLKEKCPYLPNDYIEWLRDYRFKPEEVTIEQDNELQIIIEGPWFSSILWEVPLMALISEIYFEETGQKPDGNLSKAPFKGLAFKDNGIFFADFGTRRRYSFENQDNVIRDLQTTAETNLIGTSNLYFAARQNLKPIGTQAHEWVQFHSAAYGFKNANKTAMDKWLEVFPNDLKIVLTDSSNIPVKMVRI